MAAHPTEMDEVNHADWIALEMAGGHQVIVHHGVGERRRTPFDARLIFLDGVGLLVPLAEDARVEPAWVNDILTKSLHWQARTPDARDLIVYDKELDTSVWRASLANNHKVITVSPP